MVEVTSVTLSHNFGAMSAGDSGALQQNTSGEQIFRQSFIIRRVLKQSSGNSSDFTTFWSYGLGDLFNEGGGSTALPNIFQTINYLK